MALDYRTYPVMHNGRYHHVMVGHTEHMIHIGRSFTTLEWSKLATAGYLDITMTVPAGHKCHFNYKIDAALETKFEVFADTVVTGGTTKLARNRDETSSNVDTVSITVGGTITTAGTKLAEYTWGTTSSPTVGPSVGADDSDAEIIWPENAVRRFRMTSLADANNVIARLNFNMEPI